MLSFKKHQRFDIVVVRLTKDNLLSTSRPCHHCIEFLSQFPIRYVYYSTTDRLLVRETLEELREGYQHITGANRH